MVSRFENGVCLPTEEVLTALEAAARTSRAYLYGDEDKADIPQRTAETERIAALIPHGRRNAISRAELAAAMQTSDRMMRKAVSEAKRQGVMICNDGEGYYQTEELGDLYRQYRRDTARSHVHPQGTKADAGRAESGGSTGMRSVMQYWEPERPLEPKDYDLPVCPVCGEETDTYYKNKDGVIVGCDSLH